MLRRKQNYASSDEPASDFFLSERRLTRPGRPPPSGDLREKSTCFCESTRTRYEGTFTSCLRTLYNNNDDDGAVNRRCGTSKN